MEPLLLLYSSPIFLPQYFIICPIHCVHLPIYMMHALILCHLMHHNLRVYVYCICILPTDMNCFCANNGTVDNFNLLRNSQLTFFSSSLLQKLKALLIKSPSRADAFCLHICTAMCVWKLRNKYRVFAFIMEICIQCSFRAEREEVQWTSHPSVYASSESRTNAKAFSAHTHTHFNCDA